MEDTTSSYEMRRQRREKLRRQAAGLPEPERRDFLRRIDEKETQDRIRQSSIQAPQQPSMSWWQKALSGVTYPFQQIQEKVISPVVSGAYGMAVRAIPGEQPGEKGIEQAGWNPWAQQYKQAWEETKLPLGGKFIMETLPWLAVPGIGVVGTAAKTGGTGIAGAIARTAPKLGALETPTRLAARALEYSPYGLAEKGAQVALRTTGRAVKGLVSKPPAPTIPKMGLLPDLQPFEEVVAIATTPDLGRKLANLPGISRITQTISPSTVAMKPEKKALAGYNRQLFEAHQKTLVAMQELERLGAAENIWGKVDKEGIFASGSFVGKSMQEIVEQPSKYESLMTPVQREWIDTNRKLIQATSDLASRNGVDIAKLDPIDGGEFAPRIVVGRKTPEGQFLEVAYIGGGPKGFGGKLSTQKHRVFKTVAEAEKGGWRYVPQWETQRVRISGLYRTISQNQMKDWLLEQVPWRLTEVMSLPKANTLVNAALKKKAIKPQRIEVLQRDVPEVGNRIKAALDIKDWNSRYQALQDVKTYMRTLIPTHKEQLFWAVESLTKKRVLAGNTIKALQRVKRLERLPTGTIKAISKIMPDAAEQLKTVSRYSLDDLIKAGAEAAEFPKILPPPTKGLLVKQEAALAEAQARLAANPNDAVLFRSVQSLKRKVSYTKHRMGQYAQAKEAGLPGGGTEFIKSPVSILKGQHYDAINELLDVVRGIPYKATTAGGKVETKYRGGLVEKFRAQELEAKDLRTTLIESAKKVHLGEAAIAQPAFAGKIFTGPEGRMMTKEEIELIKWVEKSLTPQFNTALGAVNKLNAVMRFFQLSGDASPFAIQLIFLAGALPSVYKDALVGFVKSLLDSEYIAKLLSDNADLLAKHRGVIMASKGTTEITEAVGQQGLLRNVPGVKQFLVPFARAYEGAIDTAGIGLIKAYDHLGTDAIRLAAVDDFINEFRGLASSAKLGVNPVWRQMETAGLLAPQYNRAIAALLMDVGKGGLRGDLARESLARGVGAIAAMTVAISAARGESPEEIAEHLDPRSPKFLTWDIAGQNVGPGSKVRSVMVAWARSINDPEKLWTQSMENPALAFIRGNLAPVASDAVDVLTGKNYFGDPTREGMLSLSKEVLAPALMPLWVQEMVMESGTAEERGLRAAAQFGGLRAYPQSPFQEMAKLAEEQTGKAWEALEPWEKAQLYVRPEIRELIEQFRNKDFVASMKLKWEYYDTQLARDTRFAEGKMTGRDWRKAYRDAMGERAAKLEQLDADLGRMETAPANPQEKAISDYFKLQKSFRDKETGMWDINDQWFDAETEYLARLQPELRAYVERNKSIYETPMVKEYKQVQQRLKPYWDVADQAWAKYPPELKGIADEIEILETGDVLAQRKAKQMLYQNPTIFWVRKTILRMREQMRRQDPEMVGYLRRFYG